MKRLGLLVACCGWGLACGGGGGPHGTDAGSGGDAAADALTDEGGADAVVDADGPDASETRGDAPAAPLPAWRSGSRLRARVVKSADGDVGFIQAIVDKDLSTTCSFMKAGDGAMRCLPPAVAPTFADVGCSQPVLPLDTGCVAPTHVTRLDACKAVALKVGAAVTPAKVYAGSPLDCAEVPMTAGQQYYALTPEADATFVAGTETRDPRGGGVEMRYWQSADGGLFPIGAWNASRVASCLPGTGSYAGRCVPGVVAQVSASVPAWSEPTCKEPLGYNVQSACDDEPASAVTTFIVGAACHVETMFFEATKFVATPYRTFNASCFAWTSPPDGYTFFTPGAAIDPSTLPVLRPALEGTGRILVKRYTSATTLVLDINPSFYDADRSEDCLVQQTSTGPRCMSMTAFGSNFYADPLCAAPVYIEGKTAPTSTCGLTRPTILYRNAVGPVCGEFPTIEMFQVGGAIAATKLYTRDTAGTCGENSLNPADYNVYGTSPATEMTAASLAIATE